MYPPQPRYCERKVGRGRIYETVLKLPRNRRKLSRFLKTLEKVIRLMKRRITALSREGPSRDGKTMTSRTNRTRSKTKRTKKREREKRRTSDRKIAIDLQNDNCPVNKSRGDSVVARMRVNLAVAYLRYVTTVNSGVSIHSC